MPTFKSLEQLVQFVDKVTIEQMAIEAEALVVEELDESIERNVYNSFGNTKSLYSGVTSSRRRGSIDGESGVEVESFIDASKLQHEYPSYDPNSPRGRQDNREYDSSFGGNIVSWIEYGQNGISPYKGRNFIGKARIKISKKLKGKIMNKMKQNGYKFGYTKVTD